MFKTSMIGLFLVCGAANAAEYVFPMSFGFVGDSVGLGWSRVDTQAIDGPNTNIAAGWAGNLAYRSAIDFDITRLPVLEKVVEARFDIRPFVVNVQGSAPDIGALRHLDAATPFLPQGPTDSDPRRFSWNALSTAPIVGSLGLGGSIVAFSGINVTSAVAADHLRGFGTSPFALVENSARHGTLGFAEYDTVRLVVDTAAPSAVRYALESLGGSRYRADYTLVDEVSAPLQLVDIDFDTSLYDEASLVVRTSGQAQNSWDASVLHSGIGTPATVTFSALAGGLQGGESASGFSVEFDWLGSGRPQSQPFAVYDPTSFDVLYAGASVAATVPETSARLSLGVGLLALAVLATLARPHAVGRAKTLSRGGTSAGSCTSG